MLKVLMIIVNYTKSNCFAASFLHIIGSSAFINVFMIWMKGIIFKQISTDRDL
jgi:hypothetical protein